MTENEAIEQLKMFPEWNRDDLWLSADDMEELVNFCTKSLEEIQQYRTIGTLEECREAREQQMINKEADIISSLTMIPSTDGNFKLALYKATVSQIQKAIQQMEGKSGNRTRTAACQKELEQRASRKRKALDAYNTLKDYCSGQGTCQDCLLKKDRDFPLKSICIMEEEDQDIPSRWKELGVD